MPVFGQLLTLADFAFIDRSDAAQARLALDEAAERLARGTSIVISPEGTRSLTPSVGAFRKGGFHLAMQAGVPIVPMVIRNAGELMWRTARTARSGTVEVYVHEPIETTGWTKQDLDAAVIRVHRLYQDTLEDWPTDAAESAREVLGS
jgi:putative phosphoserine phosphatase/1-acylglycerol-3-phosphate O-acyltransferase